MWTHFNFALDSEELERMYGNKKSDDNVKSAYNDEHAAAMRGEVKVAPGIAEQIVNIRMKYEKSNLESRAGSEPVY